MLYKGGQQQRHKFYDEWWYFSKCSFNFMMSDGVTVSECSFNFMMSDGVSECSFNFMMPVPCVCSPG